MPLTTRIHNRGRMAGLVLVGALAVFAVTLPGGPATAAGGACAHADSGIDEANAKQLARAIRCLINEDRADRDLVRLDANGDLKSAAGNHNRTMLRENCFAHRCPGEPGLDKRIKRSGYIDGAERWSYAEVIGCDATPAEMLDTWLNAQFPRTQLRKPGFRHIGVAAARDQVGRSACDAGDEATYTLLLGSRKR